MRFYYLKCKDDYMLLATHLLHKVRDFKMSFSKNSADGNLQKFTDSERWLAVKSGKTTRAPVFDDESNAGIGRYISDATNQSFIGPVISGKLKLVPYKKWKKDPATFEILVAPREYLVWKPYDKVLGILPAGAFYTNVITEYGNAYVGKHKTFGIGMISNRPSLKPKGNSTVGDDTWTYVSSSPNGDISLCFEVLCHK